MDTTTTSLSSSSSILTDKVQRALQIRTDTPAMKAALEALGGLAERVDLDARTVRYAIESDALQQALLLQKEMTRLTTTLSQLREGLHQTARIAQTVQHAVHTNVLVQQASSSNNNERGGTSMLQKSALTPEPTVDGLVDDSGVAGTNTTTASSSSAAIADEVQLAAALAGAFQRRQAAQDRVTAVHQFLETFDLSPEESDLLDRYHLDDDSALVLSLHPSVATAGGDASRAWAFLAALERVKTIRQALSQTFGGGGSGMGGDAVILDSTAAGGSSSLGASSALRMMENLAQKQEQAYERLYHWLQTQLIQPSAAEQQQQQQQASKEFAEALMDQQLQHPFIQRALYTLRHVPAFSRHMMELIANRRRQEETRLFLLALTSGYAGQLPLERLAHDPVAYTGDMLATAFSALSAEADVARSIVHYKPVEEEEEEAKDKKDAEQTTSPEDETAETTTGETAAGEAETKTQQEDDAFDFTEKRMTATDILSTSMSGMARPLKSRILQVVTSLARRSSSTANQQSEDQFDDGLFAEDVLDDPGAVVRSQLTHLYEICGLLLFYNSVMEKTVRKIIHADQDNNLLPKDYITVGKEVTDRNVLLANITGCVVEASKAFEATLRVYSAMLGHASNATGDSIAQLTQSLLLVLAQVRETSPGFAVDIKCPPSARECETILSLNWITQMLMEAALGDCRSLDDAHALQTALDATIKAGLDLQLSLKLKDAVQETQTKLVDKLVETEGKQVLQQCGLDRLVKAWGDWKQARETEEDPTILMVTMPGLTVEDVKLAVQSFYASLYSPPIPSLETTIKDPTLRQRARSAIAKFVADLYEKVYQDITSSGKGGYEDLSFMGHTPQQVHTLFSV